MYKNGEYVVYNKNVCVIKGLKVRDLKLYYILKPIDDNNLLIEFPVDNCAKLMRNVISIEDANLLINKIPSIDTIKAPDKLIEKEYKRLLSTGLLEDLVKIIKTTYLRNKTRTDNNKRIGETDDNYFHRAERLLYNELSISLGKEIKETKDYVTKKVDSLTL